MFSSPGSSDNNPKKKKKLPKEENGGHNGDGGDGCDSALVLHVDPNAVPPWVLS